MSTARCLISIPRNSRRWPLRSAVSALALAALAGAGVLASPRTPSASAQSLTESASEECEAVDLLLLMDQSGSLNSIDPDGTQRSKALKSIRSDFSGDDRWHVALIGFNEVPLLHSAWFRLAADSGQRHPSDDEIAEALPGQGFTYYGVALDAGLTAFDRAREESCRHLVWFTDGLHDTAPGSTAGEVQKAEALRDTVCRVTAPSYNSEGVSTSVVLLGDSFEEKLRSSDRNERRMAELSLDIIGIMTGERVIAGRPVDAACPTADLPKKGEVYQVGDIADLINSIIEATLPARGLLRWSDCDTSEGNPRYSDNLPAGAYIDEIQVLSYRGAIERYRLGQGQWIEASAGSRRIGLNRDVLSDLAAGWELVIEVVADGGRDIGEVSLSCWSKPVGPLREWVGVVQDANGETVEVLVQDQPYTLRVVMSPHECPVEALELDSVALAAPLQHLGCESGTEALLHFDAVPSGGVQEMTEASGHVTPLHAGVLWGDRGEIAVEVDVELGPIFISDRPLVCDQAGDSPRVERVLLDAASRPRIVAGECTVVPQQQGQVTVDIESPPDGPRYHFETPDGNQVADTLTLGSADDPQKVRIISTEIGPQMLSIESHEVAVTARHQRSEDADALSADRQSLLVPAVEPWLLMCERAGPGGLAASSNLLGSLIEESRSAADAHSEVVVVGRCTLQPPLSGSRMLQIGGGLRLVDESGAPLAEPTTVTSGEPPLSIVILRGLGDGGPPTDGEPIVRLQQVSTDPGPRVLPVVHQLDPAKIDALRDVRLTCGLEDDLPRIESAAPFRVTAAACRIEPPRAGTLTVGASVRGEPRYYVVEPDGVRFVGTTIGSGDPPLGLRVVSESLGPAGWSTEGELVLTIALAPGDGPALVAAHIVAVPELVLPSPLECEFMQFMNADGDEVPSEPLEATLRCSSAWRGPDGQLTLALAAGTGLLAPDWRFQPASTLLNDGRGLRFGDGEVVTEVRLVTSGPLPNDRIVGDGTVVIEAQWMVPGWKEPLTGVTTARYSVDLWPRSVLWLAVLITLVAAMLSWLLLYGVVAFKNRLPTASNFYARRFEISTYRDARGGLRSTEIDNFNFEDHPSIPVSGDSSQKRLRSEDLRIDARHPKWWQIASLLRGGWGEATAGPNRIVAVRPAGPRTRAGSTPERFTELAVIALDSRSGAAEPLGIAYLLVPRAPSERPDLRRDLADALADLSGPRGTDAGAEPKPPRSERPK